MDLQYYIMHRNPELTQTGCIMCKKITTHLSTRGADYTGAGYRGTFIAYMCLKCRTARANYISDREYNHFPSEY